MNNEEHAKRLAILIALYDSLGRRLSDEGAAMLAQTTAHIPYPWLRDACFELGKTWDESQRNPGAPAIFRAAARIAGFRAVAGAYDYFDPQPDTVRWWPPGGEPVSGELATSWGSGVQSVQPQLERRFGKPPLLPERT